MWLWRSTGCLERSRSVWRRDPGRTEVCDWRSVRGGSRGLSVDAEDSAPGNAYSRRCSTPELGCQTEVVT